MKSDTVSYVARKEAKGGHCLEAWKKSVVHWSFEDLVFPIFKTWIAPWECGGYGCKKNRTKPSLGYSPNSCSRSGSEFLLHSFVVWYWRWSKHFILECQVRGFLSIALWSDIGDGANTLFRSDRLLQDQCAVDIIPCLHAIIPKRISRKHTAQEALTNQAWISNIQGQLTVGILIEFLR
jgi:hypothetical protein